MRPNVFANSFSHVSGTEITHFNFETKFYTSKKLNSAHESDTYKRLNWNGLYQRQTPA